MNAAATVRNSSFIGTSLQVAALSQRHTTLLAYHNVIERSDSDQIQCVLQFRGEVSIRHAGFRVTRRVVVHQDQGGGVVLRASFTTSLGYTLAPSRVP